MPLDKMRRKCILLDRMKMEVVPMIYRNRWCRYISIVIGCALFAPGVRTVYGQKIKTDVQLMLEALPLDKQEKLKNFADDLEIYFNDWDWTKENSDEEIPVSITIFLMDNSVSYEDRYSGTFLISNNRDDQYYDKYWKFPYQFGSRIEHNESVYHPMTGFLDFYLNMIIGGEFDKYGTLLGTPFFEKAKLISDQAKFSTQFIIGWEERTRLIDRIMSEDYKTYRIMKDAFFLGLSYAGEEEGTARRYLGEALDLMEKTFGKAPDHKET